MALGDHGSGRRAVLVDKRGREVKFSDFRGEPVVVYFYPKAHTPGSI